MVAIAGEGLSIMTKTFFAGVVTGMLGGIIGAFLVLHLDRSRITPSALAAMTHPQDLVSARRIQLIDAGGKVRAELATSGCPAISKRKSGIAITRRSMTSRAIDNGRWHVLMVSLGSPGAAAAAASSLRAGGTVPRFVDVHAAVRAGERTALGQNVVRFDGLSSNLTARAGVWVVHGECKVSRLRPALEV
jgi:hypothetical protein